MQPTAGFEKLHSFAVNAYLLLPLILAGIAGLCMLIATLRKSIDGVQAASFAGLAGVVVLGAALTAPRHPPLGGQPAHRAAAPAGVAAAADHTTCKAALQQRESDIELLREKVKALEAKLSAKPVEKPAAAPAPASTSAPAPVAPTTPPAPADPRPDEAR